MIYFVFKCFHPEILKKSYMNGNGYPMYIYAPTVRGGHLDLPLSIRLSKKF